MPVRSSTFDGVQLGVESLSAPGTAVSASKKVQSLSLDLQPKINTARFRPYGDKYDALVVYGKDWSEYKVDGKVDYANMVYPLASVVTAPAITTVGTNGRKWTFTSQNSAPDAPQTYTIDTGSAFRGQRATFGLFSEFGAKFDRDGAAISGSVLARNMQDPIFMTGNAVVTITPNATATGGTFTLTDTAQTTSALANTTTAAQLQAALWGLSSIGNGNVLVTGGPFSSNLPFVLVYTGALGNQVHAAPTGNFASLTGATTTAIVLTQAGSAITTVTAQPIIPGSVDVFVDTTSGALGTTKLLLVKSVEVNIGGRWTPYWALNSAQASWTDVAEMNPDLTIKLRLVADGAGMAYLTALRANNVQTYFMQISSTGPSLPAPDAAFNYSMKWQFAAKVEMPNDMPEDGGAVVVDWQFRPVNDPTWGKAFTVELINLLTAL